MSGLFHDYAKCVNDLLRESDSHLTPNSVYGRVMPPAPAHRHELTGWESPAASTR
jgi:hypothetical protein